MILTQNFVKITFEIGNGDVGRQRLEIAASRASWDPRCNLLVGEASPNPFEQSRAGTGYTFLRNAFMLGRRPAGTRETVSAIPPDGLSLSASPVRRSPSNGPRWP